MQCILFRMLLVHRKFLLLKRFIDYALFFLLVNWLIRFIMIRIIFIFLFILMIEYLNIGPIKKSIRKTMAAIDNTDTCLR
jgi:hypothetical protein